MPEHREREHRFRPVVWSMVMVLVVVRPVRGWLEKLFGDGAQLWALIVVLVTMVIYAFIKRRKGKEKNGM